MRKKIFALFLALSLLLCALSPAVSALEVNGSDIKNVIFMIGDGMGENHLEWTKAEQNIALCMDTLPYKGYSITDSLSGLTDSAAGGTALACGRHTYNSNVATLSPDIGDGCFTLYNYTTLAELAKANGMKAGILTSDSNTGATPAAFSAHVKKRTQEKEITEQQLKSDFDLIWSEDAGFVSEKDAAENGWDYVTRYYEIEKIEPDCPIFGQFSHVCYDDGGKSTSPLSTLTELAIDRLDCDEGFFLMVEGAHIDKYSHSNDKEGMMFSLIEFDKAVRKAVDFAKEDGHTMVIVTADHETGGITKDETTGTYSFTIGNHTQANVPLRIYGASGLVANGESVVNCEVSKFAASAISAKRFPMVSLNKLLIPDLIVALWNGFIGLFK